MVEGTTSEIIEVGAAVREAVKVLSNHKWKDIKGDPTSLKASKIGALLMQRSCQRVLNISLRLIVGAIGSKTWWWNEYMGHVVDVSLYSARSSLPAKVRTLFQNEVLFASHGELVEAGVEFVRDQSFNVSVMEMNDKVLLPYFPRTIRRLIDTRLTVNGFWELEALEEPKKLRAVK